MLQFLTMVLKLVTNGIFLPAYKKPKSKLWSQSVYLDAHYWLALLSITKKKIYYTNNKKCKRQYQADDSIANDLAVRFVQFPVQIPTGWTWPIALFPIQTTSQSQLSTSGAEHWALENERKKRTEKRGFGAMGQACCLIL